MVIPVNDYDLGLYSYDTSSYVAISADTQDGDDNPLEWFSYTVPDGTPTGDYAIVVDKWSGDGKTLEVYIYTSNGAGVYIDNIDPVDSIFGHAAVPNAIAVGAIDASDPGNDDIEAFSSQGPVTISYPSSVSRSKPDLCGIDGVLITGAGGFGYWDGSNYRFYGTSAAAPHVAAIAAQLWGAYPDKTGAEIRSLLYASAVDLGDVGFDTVYGYGRADALAAYGESPQVSTNPASDIGTTSATLNGNLDSTGGLDCTVWFKYGYAEDEPDGWETISTIMHSPGSYSVSLSGLDPDRVYWFRAFAENSNGEAHGVTRLFQTEEETFPPQVTTNAATNVEETTATLNGVISNDGGEACQYRFEYDTNSGEPYAHNTGWTGSKTTGQSFNAALPSLNKGTKYYFRAQAKNSAGTGSGSELTFLTKPDAPTGFSASPAGTTQIDLSWTKGAGAQKTKIQRKQGSYPSNKDDGTQVYFDIGNQHTGHRTDAGHNLLLPSMVLRPGQRAMVG